MRPSQALTKKELALKVFEANPDSGLNKGETLELLNSFIETIALTLAEGRKVSFKALGTLEPHYQAPRKARDVVAGTPLEIQERYTLRLKPSKQIKEKLTNSLL